MRRLAVLISGRGSNLKALIEACADPYFPADIALVVSNKPDAGGLNYAKEAGIPTAVVDHRAYDDKPAFEAALDACLREYRVDLVCLAGFMRILSAHFVERWSGRLLNIHPSLLPLFKGLDTHRRALEAGVRFAGCTVHFVTAEMDSGAIIAQAVVPVLPDDSEADLAGRVLAEEHRLYPLALRLVAEGRATLNAAGRCVLTESQPCQTVLINPEK